MGLLVTEHRRIFVPTDHVATTAGRWGGPDDVHTVEARLAAGGSAEPLKLDRATNGGDVSVHIATVWMKVMDLSLLAVAAGSVRYVDTGQAAVGVHARDIAEYHWSHRRSIRFAHGPGQRLKSSGNRFRLSIEGKVRTVTDEPSSTLQPGPLARCRTTALPSRYRSGSDRRTHPRGRGRCVSRYGRCCP